MELRASWARSWEPRGDQIGQNSIKMGFRSRSRFGIVLTSILTWNLSRQTLKSLVYNTEYCFLARLLVALKIDVDAFLVPTWLHFGTSNDDVFEILGFQEAFNNRSFFTSICCRFGLRLGFQLGAILGPKMAPTSHRNVNVNININITHGPTGPMGPWAQPLRWRRPASCTPSRRAIACLLSIPL